jgi:uncharacterized protein YfaS (alpha-2-macroglobulin family)
MRLKLLIATTLVVAIFLSACNRDFVALDYTNAKGEVPQLSNLVFRFNKSLVSDSLLHHWDSSEYISFQPRLEGRFRWEAPDQLVFSPSRPLSPATSYTVQFHDEVLRYSKYDKVQTDKEVSFHTAPLQLSNAEVTWILQDESSRLALPQVVLQFNYPVKPEELKDKLSIDVDGKKLDYTLQTLSASNEVAVRLNSFKGEDRSYEAQVKIDKGLVPQGGKNATREPIQTLLSIPSPYVLNINSIESEHDGTEGVVRIGTSQQLLGDNITSFIKFEPAISYTVDHTPTGIILRSDKFSAEESYALTINRGLRGRIGGVLKEAYNESVAFGQLEPAIRFTNSKAVYLSKGGGGNIEVKISNVPKVKLIISKIYESNLLTAERSGYMPPNEDRQAEYASYAEEEGWRGYSEAVAGDVIYSKEIDTRSLKKSGGGRVLNIAQFSDRLPDLKGIYHVMLRSSEDYWVQDSRFISLSDIGLMARQGQDKMLVFANSIKTAGAIDGVTVKVYGNNNQLLGTGATNKDGVAEVAISQRPFSGFKPAMIIASTADDFTYLPFTNTKVNTSRFDVGGKRNNPTGLDAFVYPERDIYRPGERVNFAVLVRDRKWKSPGELPVKIKVLLPNGKELKTFRKTLNEGGSTESSLDISSAAITGSYLVEVYSSNDVLLASKNIMIEEFVPDRIKVTTQLNKPAFRPGEEAVLSINAVNFFGPPAANRNYETEIQVKQKEFAAKAFADYEFALVNQQSFFDKEVQQGKTDESGNATGTFTVPSMYTNIGLLQANFYTTVFDETGRPVSRLASTPIYTQDVFHGVKDDGMYYYPLNHPVAFKLVSVNRDGAAVNAAAHVKVIKHEYRTVLSKRGSYFRYDSQKEDKLMTEGMVTIGSGTPYSFIPRSPGDYEVRIYRPGANAYVSKSFYSYGSWGGEASSFEVNTEGHIDIELDKEGYHSGETAKVLFKAPFSGRMLVTVERDGVQSYQYVNVVKRTASLDLKLAGDHVPNVYITATLIKPHEVSDIPLTVAHGFQNVRVEERGRKMPVEIRAQKTSRSHTRQRVSVKAAPNSYVTLAAVDNGVLQVTDFKTPDPYSYYYQKQALEVTSYDMYPLLFPEVRARLSSTGGDGETDMNKRVNPMPAKRFKLLSYWSGIKKTNSSGTADFEFEVPQFNGQVRLMAVAYKNEQFGSSEATMQVADPLVISSALPRFLSPGDTVQVPITISNTTAKGASGQATITAGGPVKVVGAATQSISIPANSETRAVFHIVAAPTVDVSKITVQVKALGEQFSDETEIAVRPPASLQKVTGSGSIVGGSLHRITIPGNDFLPGSFDYELVVSRSPVAEIADQLRWLVQYPYGCTEQTISSAFPQLYYVDLSNTLQSGKGRAANANANVLEAIRKIKMRQLYNGAVTLWDGEGQADWWTTTYAAHFLLEARKAGFDVDNSLLETMLGYLANRLKTKETINYYYNRDQQRKIAPKEVPYSLYVLSLANRTQVSAMNYYKANPQLLALDGRYLLSAAYAVGGDKRSYTAFLPTSFSGEASVQQTGGSFYSETRDEAIALNALMDVDPGNPQVPVMARHVSERLKKERYLNTQERAFSFLALGKLARSAARSNVTAEIRSNGKVIGKIDGNDWKAGKEVLRSSNLEVVTKGSGRLYYSWQAEGISASGAHTEEDNFVKIRRSYYDRNGKPLTTNTFKQNDLVIVRLTLEKAYSNTIENLVLTDILPAGLEIENGRTKELPGMDWIKGASDPVALDVRDDRIHFFVDATKPVQSYYYAVRAVSLGRFRQGPASADAMYNGEIHSYHGAGTIRVVSR